MVFPFIFEAAFARTYVPCNCVKLRAHARFLMPHERQKEAPYIVSWNSVHIYLGMCPVTRPFDS